LILKKEKRSSIVDKMVDKDEKGNLTPPSSSSSQK
jgi:hypothetical protein